MSSPVDLYSRTASGVLVNTDDTQYQAILQKRMERNHRKQIEARLDRLDDELDTIKYMLTQILEKGL